jgi:hypothetical protein
MTELRGIRDLPEDYHEVNDTDRRNDDHSYRGSDIVNALTDLTGWSLPRNVSPLVTAGIATGVALFAIGALFGSRRVRTAATSAGSRAYHAVVGDDEPATPRRRARAPARRASTRKAATAAASPAKKPRRTRAASNGTTSTRRSSRRKADAETELLH